MTLNQKKKKISLNPIQLKRLKKKNSLTKIILA